MVEGIEEVNILKAIRDHLTEWQSQVATNPLYPNPIGAVLVHPSDFAESLMNVRSQVNSEDGTFRYRGFEWVMRPDSGQRPQTIRVQ